MEWFSDFHIMMISIHKTRVCHNKFYYRYLTLTVAVDTIYNLLHNQQAYLEKSKQIA